MAPPTRSKTRWLLLHGTPLDPEVWGDVRRHLTGDVVVPDLNDLVVRAGRVPGPVQGPVQEHVAAALLADLPDHESDHDHEDLIVVGHSFGGQVAIELALKAPHRIKRLIIVSSRHTPFAPFALGARQVRNGAPFDVEAGLTRWLTPEERAADPPVIAYLRRRLATAARGPWAASLDAIATYDRSTKVQDIATPARLFAAGRDEVAGPAVMTQLARALRDARLEIVATWSHMSPFADPEAFAAMLREAADQPMAAMLREAADQPMAAMLREAADQPIAAMLREQADQPAVMLREQADQPAVMLREQADQPAAMLREQADQPPAMLREQAD